MEQKYVESQLTAKGVRCRRVLFSDLVEKGRLDSEGNYYLCEELVSFAYFRTGFNLKMYAGNVEEARRCREQLAASNAISIPAVAMELVNLKRVQVEMSKPAVARKFLSEGEAQRVLGSLVASWEFDSLSAEEGRAVAEMFRRNPEGFVLKPNREGGCNNVFGEEGARLLGSLSAQERRQYVLQEIIPPVFEENEIMVDVNRVARTSCKYELGRYGVLSEVRGQLRRNETHGYLVKSHARGFNEVSITKGTASVVAWKQE